MAWSANYTPTAPRRGLGELGVSGVNRDALVGHQPGQHTGAKPELENRVLILIASTRTAVAFSNRGVIQDLVNSNGSSGTIGLLSG
jgi:hypothetical protein